MRLRSRWAMATALPMIIDRIESAATIFIHEACWITGVIDEKIRMRAMSVAAFGATLAIQTIPLRAIAEKAKLALSNVQT